MIHKLALGLGALTAVGVLVAAMTVGGLAARSARAGETVAQTAADATPATRTQVDTVYVKPAPKQKVVHITKTTHPSSPPARQVVTVTAPRHGDDGEGGHGGERDGGD